MATLIIAYVFTGGAISVGAAGFVTLIIAFAALLVFGIVALYIAGGPAPLQAALPETYFNLFGNGFGISTMATRDLYQHYLRPKTSDREGLLVAHSVIVVVVLAGVLIGASDLLKLIIN